MRRASDGPAGPRRSDAMTEKPRSNNKQPPWQREADTEAVPFGPWLRRQREMREITLREISDASKISLRYLQALEDERFDLLPAMVFAKGFLRQYARYVGLDQDEVVNRFLIASRDESEEEEEADGEEAAGGPGLGAPRALDGAWKYAILIVVVAIALLAIVFLLPRLFGRSGGGARPDQPPPGVSVPDSTADQPAAAETAQSPAGPSIESPSVRSPAARAVRPPAAAVTGDAPLRVTLDFREDCWVEATVDGARRVAEMRVQGESLQLQAQQEVDLRLGNAGVVDIEVNGQPYPLQATPGQVRHVQIDLSDLPGGQGGPGGGAGARAEDTSPTAAGAATPSQP